MKVRMHLSRVNIKNFRCLDSVQIDLKPITVIYGLNGSGKTSILAAIQLLKQSIGEERLVTEGTLNIGPLDGLVKEMDKAKWVTIGLEISYEKGEFAEQLVYSHLSFFGMKSTIKTSEYEVSFRANRGFIELRQTLRLNGKPLFETLSSRENGIIRDKMLFPDIRREATPSNSRKFLNENLGEFSYSGRRDSEIENFKDRLRSSVRDVVRMFRHVLSNYFLIGPTRGTRLFEAKTPTDPQWVGYEGEGASGLLSKIWGKTELSQKRLKIAKWATIFGLSDLWAGFHGGDKLGVTFRDPETHTPVNLDAAGHGSKQALILITQMFHSDKGSIIAVEEPEISLHLGLQIQLPKLFSEYIHEKKQIIVTTHSSQILTAFRESFKKRALTKNDLAVHHLQKTQQGTTSLSLEVTRTGMVKPFPPSIAKAEKELVSQAFK